MDDANTTPQKSETFLCSPLPDAQTLSDSLCLLLRLLRRRFGHSAGARGFLGRQIFVLLFRRDVVLQRSSQVGGDPFVVGQLLGALEAGRGPDRLDPLHDHLVLFLDALLRPLAVEAIVGDLTQRRVARLAALARRRALPLRDVRELQEAQLAAKTLAAVAAACAGLQLHSGLRVGGFWCGGGVLAHHRTVQIL